LIKEHINEIITGFFALGGASLGLLSNIIQEDLRNRRSSKQEIKEAISSLLELWHAFKVFHVDEQIMLFFSDFEKKFPDVEKTHPEAKKTIVNVISEIAFDLQKKSLRLNKADTRDCVKKISKYDPLTAYYLRGTEDYIDRFEEHITVLSERAKTFISDPKGLLEMRGFLNQTFLKAGKSTRNEIEESILSLSWKCGVRTYFGIKKSIKKSKNNYLKRSEELMRDVNELVNKTSGMK
jgi:hypothetical protein